MQRLGGGHDDAVWAMVAAAENLDYSHYLKPAASLKFQHEKHAVLDARDFNGLDNEPAAMELDPSVIVKNFVLLLT